MKTNEKHLQLERERFQRYGYDYELLEIEGRNIQDYLNQLKGDILFQVNCGTLDIVVLNDGYVNYDFHGLNRNGKVGAGYYSRKYGKRKDNRTGRRKLYSSSKGLYFIESGYRRYLKDFIRK